VRRPLPVSSEYVGPGARPDFHAFDNVLLVVFFSHARYDINLDGYREVYSPYFPNVRILSLLSTISNEVLDIVHRSREP
jgi:hypothetical protein